MCGVRTCRVCKKSAHEGKCLPQLDWLMEKLMNKKIWKRCTKCSRVIELKEGCPHIICICRAQWCYHCGKKWKTCDCPK
ncbi:hypothetical protein DTO027I6_6248 [Penicillium roqueforti]|uniref:uncharacterized protein n=1 Tax=Penicillium roqueforti TaxID=5082 RepID=UPI00190A97DC|nr:uncharacterized protein LCP9604111_5723 [Penicillium roqueforti]KAF9248014.1 hypothetical protein LCP9604111_5723 [Penicillium roqueforti]KAI2686139.1 hypothetical protein CBS147355_1626 [Penicillium roqueforti]KAI2705327.1 hypothetical protein CBS147372_1630 [Penicillium roqueforti]KAI2714861.1 hypothetical protein CBS147318_6438 [Penicillium roqueforti]KAI2731551.1 hypothetical protein CBS147354_660 [Penicillium roqueforti]